MCSEGVSVWFACKLCPSFFLNADDFAYHKKKSHVEEFRSAKFIVFEEQTTSTALPPKNWVSFLSPKEETIIHKIISPPGPPSLSTTTNVDSSPSALQRNKNIQSNSHGSEKSIEINSENNADSNDCDASNKVTNKSVELISFFKSISNTEKAVDIQENDSLQRNIPPTRLVHVSTDEKRDKLLSAIIKSAIKCKRSSLKRSQDEIHNVPSKKARQIVPYVYHQKRINLEGTTQAGPSHSNSNNTIHSNETDTLNKNRIISSNEKTTNPLEVPTAPATDQELFKQIDDSESTARSPSLATSTSLPCKFCPENFSSTPELDNHEEICRLKTQFENIFCPLCCLTFCSSDELNAHNRTLHSTSFSTPESSDVTKANAEFADEVEVSSEIKIEPEIWNQSKMTNWTLSKNCDTDNNSKSDGQQDFISNTSTKVKFIYDHAFGVVKTEHADANENSEFPAIEQDPFQSEIKMESSAKETAPNAAAAAASPSNNADGNQEKHSRQHDLS